MSLETSEEKKTTPEHSNMRQALGVLYLPDFVSADFAPADFVLASITPFFAKTVGLPVNEKRSIFDVFAPKEPGTDLRSSLEEQIKKLNSSGFSEIIPVETKLAPEPAWINLLFQGILPKPAGEAGKAIVLQAFLAQSSVGENSSSKFVESIKIMQRGRNCLDNEETILRTVLDSTPDLVFIKDVSGHYLACNRAYEETTGYSEDMVAGKLDRELYSFKTAENFEKCDKAALEKGGAYINEETVLHKDHLVFFETIRIPYYSEDGVPLGLLGISRDITDRKAVEESLKKAKLSADQANRAKTMFLSNMSHEIRTPLNAILGFTQILTRDPSISSENKTYLNSINRNGENLLDLINDILEVSKMESGEAKLNNVTFDLPSLLEEIVSIFKIDAELKGLVFNTDIEPKLPVYVNGDAVKLKQVFINLLKNAIKFTEAGEISLHISGKTLNDDYTLQVEVADTGYGIDQKEMDSLFRYFEKTETGHNIGGSGLGLAISRVFVELMGGTISAASEPNKGSVFKFDVNLKTVGYAQEDDVCQESMEVIGLANKKARPRVLIVDNKNDEKEILRCLLSPKGFKVIDASDEKEALKRFFNCRPDLAIVDMDMPAAGALQFLKEIQLLLSDKPVPILALSSESFPEDRKKLLAQGFDDVIAKPLQENELLLKLKNKLKLEYLYSKKSENKENVCVLPDESREIADLKPELISEIKEAIDSADLDLLLEIFDRLPADKSALAAKLKQMAQSFQYEAILELIDPDKISE